MLALKTRSVAAHRLRRTLPLPFTVARVRFYAVVDAPPPAKTKVWDSVDDAVKDVKSGDILLSGGAFELDFGFSHVRLP